VAEAAQRVSRLRASGRLARPALLLALPPLATLAVFGAAPLILIGVWSFWRFDPATYWIKPDFNLAAYRDALSPDRTPVLVRTGGLALLTAAISTAIALPAASAIALFSGSRLRSLMLALFTIPFFTSGLVRAFAWRLVLGRNGLINQALLTAGLIDAPLEWLLFSDFAVILGMVAADLPFAIVPIVLAYTRIEPSILRASEDLGAGFWTTFARVVFPLVLPGVVSAFLFVFVVAIGASSEVQLLGGAGSSSISIMINDVMRVVNFPLAFAIATLVIVILVIALLVAEWLLGLSRLLSDLVS
jgi:putative spermidine/putrescine transport system permease protein